MFAAQTFIIFIDEVPPAPAVSAIYAHRKSRRL